MRRNDAAREARCGAACDQRSIIGLPTLDRDCDRSILINWKRTDIVVRGFQLAIAPRACVFLALVEIQRLLALRSILQQFCDCLRVRVPMPRPACRNRETFAFQKIAQSARVVFPAAVVSDLVEVDTIAPSFRGGEGVRDLARRSGYASAPNKTRFSFHCAINAMLDPLGASSSTISSLAASASISRTLGNDLRPPMP